MLSLLNIGMNETDCRVALGQGAPWRKVPLHFRTTSRIAYWVARGQSKAEIIHAAIPSHRKTSRFYKKVLQENPDLVRYEPAIFAKWVQGLNAKKLAVVFELSPDIFPVMSDAQITLDYCKRALAHNTSYFEHIPKRFHNDALYRFYLQQWPAIRHIPESALTEELIKLALTNVRRMTREDLRLVPKSLFTEEIYQTLLIDPIEFLEFIPQRLLTKDVCMNMFQGREYMSFQLYDIARYIPEAYREEVMRSAHFYRHVDPYENSGPDE